MKFTITEFRDITFAVFFIYVFFETKIYLAIWVGLFHVLNMTLKMFFFNNVSIYKVTISVYVIAVLAGYLYRFRNVLLGKEKPVNSNKWKNLSTDKIKQRRIGIAILLLIIINVAAIFIFKKG